MEFDEENVSMEDVIDIIKNQSDFKKWIKKLSKAESIDEIEDIMAKGLAMFLCNNMANNEDKKIDSYIN